MFARAKRTSSTACAMAPRETIAQVMSQFGLGVTETAAGAETAIGASGDAAIASGTSSSTNDFITVPIGRLALVPVIKNPAGRNTIADTATAPTPPAVPLSSKAPLNLIWRPLTSIYSGRPDKWPDLPHIPLLITSVISPTAGLPTGTTVTPCTTTASLVSSLILWPTRSFFPLVVSSSSSLRGTSVPTRSTAWVLPGEAIGAVTCAAGKTA